MRHRILLVLLLFSQFARADERDASSIGTDLSSERQEHVFTFLIGAEVSDLALSEQNLAGIGPSLGLNYSFNPKWSAQTLLNQSFSVTEASYLYTGIYGGVFYNLFGSPYSDTLTVKQGDRVVIQSSASRLGKFFAAGVGIDQLFLSGSKAVYPSTGLSLGMQYQTTIWDQVMNFSLRAGSFTSPTKSYPAVLIGLRIPVEI